jgi:hypothetical protein
MSRSFEVGRDFVAYGLSEQVFFTDWFEWALATQVVIKLYFTCPEDKT